MRAASCFSGIGGAEAAYPEGEWLWCAEIEPQPAEILSVRFPHSEQLGDVLATDFLDRAGAHGPLDLLCGGPPCQAFSVAGLRGGMSDPRGQLSLRFVEIAHATRPRNLLVENVPGWLNHEDNAFGCFLGAIVGADDALRSPLERGRWPDAGMVAGPRARAAWRVLDAQYFGLAQRRERVFVVVDFGDGADPAAVLFEPNCGIGDPAAGRKAGQGVAGTLSARTQGGGGLGTDFELGGGLTPACVTARMTAIGEYADDDTASTLKARDFKDATDLIAHTLRGEGFDASEDGTGRGTPLVPEAVCIHADAVNRTGEALTPSPDAEGRVRLRDTGMGISEGVSFNLTTGQPHVIAFPAELSGTQVAAAEDRSPALSVKHTMAIAMQAGMVRENPNSGPDGKGWQPDVAYTLEARAEVQAVAFDTTQLTSPGNYSNPQPGDPCHPLAAPAHVPAIAFTSKDYGGDATADLSPTLRSMGHDGSHANGGGQVAVAFDMRGREGGAQMEGPHDTANLRAASGGSSRSYVATQWAVRRLTPTECERLQGFPDGHTLIETGKRRTVEPDEADYLRSHGAIVVNGNDGKIRTNAMADGPRYKGLGNAWAVPVARWIIKRIEALQPAAEGSIAA